MIPKGKVRSVSNDLRRGSQEALPGLTSSLAADAHISRITSYCGHRSQLLPVLWRQDYQRRWAEKASPRLAPMLPTDGTVSEAEDRPRMPGLRACLTHHNSDPTC